MRIFEGKIIRISFFFLSISITYFSIKCILYIDVKKKKRLDTRGKHG